MRFTTRHASVTGIRLTGNPSECSEDTRARCGVPTAMRGETINEALDDSIRRNATVVRLRHPDRNGDRRPPIPTTITRGLAASITELVHLHGAAAAQDRDLTNSSMADKMVDMIALSTHDHQRGRQPPNPGPATEGLEAFVAGLIHLHGAAAAQVRVATSSCMTDRVVKVMNDIVASIHGLQRGRQPPTPGPATEGLEAFIAGLAHLHGAVAAQSRVATSSTMTDNVVNVIGASTHELQRGRQPPIPGPATEDQAVFVAGLVYLHGAAPVQVERPRHATIHGANDKAANIIKRHIASEHALDGATIGNYVVADAAIAEELSEACTSEGSYNRFIEPPTWPLPSPRWTEPMWHTMRIAPRLHRRVIQSRLRERIP